VDPLRDTANKGKADKEPESVKLLKQGMHQFVVTMKNLALYPITSQTNKQALTSFHEWLVDYLKNFGALIVFVAKDGIYTQNAERVYEEKPNDPILSFPLFRDGIQSIIFEPTITEEELRTFINILLRFRTLTESDQDDIVTAMWEASFNSLKYTIADEYEAVDPEFEIDAMIVAKMPDPTRPDIDAPWQATAPVEVEGDAPVAKSVSSLFALAETLDFTFAPGGKEGKVQDPHEGGKLLDSEEDKKAAAAKRALEEAADEAEYDSNLSSDGMSGIGKAELIGGDDEDMDPEELDSEESTGGSTWADEAMSMDLSSLSLDDFEDNTEMEALATRQEVDEELLAGRAERLKFWGLNSKEIKQLSAFILWDETRSKTYSVLEVVMIILKSPILRSSMRPYLVAFTFEEIISNITSLSLPHANAFLAELKEFAASSEKRTPKLIYDELIKRLDDPLVFSILSDKIETDATLDDCYESLRYFLYQLPPRAVLNIGVCINNAKSLLFKKLLLEVLGYFITTSPLDNLPKLINILNEWALLELLNLFHGFGRPLPIPVLTSLIKNQSVQVREATALYILENEPENTQLLAPLVVDRIYKIRQIVTPALTSRRDPLVENVLMDYLMNLNRQKKVPEGDERLLDLYRALGLSASSRSLDFLEEILLRKDFKTLFERGGDTHRVGAALALFLMPKNSGSEEILQKASKSAFRNIRFAHKEANKHLNYNME
jgi:hypothetical protein